MKHDKVTHNELYAILTQYIETELKNPSFIGCIPDNVMYLVEKAGWVPGPYKHDKNSYYNFDAHLKAVRKQIKKGATK